jgi:hypothetical protein
MGKYGGHMNATHYIMIVYHFLGIFDITISLFGAVILNDCISNPLSQKSGSFLGPFYHYPGPDLFFCVSALLRLSDHLMRIIK